MPKNTIDLEAIRKIAMSLPDVVEGTLHGVPSWKVRGKLLACPAIHRSTEPDTLAVRVDPDRRAELIGDFVLGSRNVVVRAMV